MEIAPIAGVRAISLRRQPKAALTGEPRFEIEASARFDDDTYSHDGSIADSCPDEATSDEANACEMDPQEPGPTDSTPSIAHQGSTINVVV